MAIPSFSKKRIPSSIRCQASDGTVCDSKTEMTFYETLKRLGLDFRFQVKVELVGPAIHKATAKEVDKLPLFQDRGAEAIGLKVDFVFDHDGITYYVDTKGAKAFTRRDSKMRYDMLKHKLYHDGQATKSRILFIEDSEVKTLAKYAAYLPGEFWLAFSKIKER